MNSNPEQRLDQAEDEIEFPGSWLMGFFLFGGVLLPMVALVVELATGYCSQHFFDPIPTWWHVLMVAFVPATNFQTWLAFRTGYTLRPTWLSFANAISIFVSLYYTLIFAPLLPIAIIAILAFFLGLLPLSPVFSLIAALGMRFRMRLLFRSSFSNLFQWKTLAGGFFLVFSSLAIGEARFTVTRVGIAKANSADAATQYEGVAMLRRFGDTDHLLRLSYNGSAAVTSDLLYRVFVSEPRDFEASRSLSKQAQKAYYRMTGRSYRQVPTPSGVRNWERIEAFDDLDPNGSFRVNPGLSLSASQIDGSVDPDAALGYLEWTLVFKNESFGQQEAVSQIQLPPGAVVSRLTLWINGEEREAAFARSAKVAEAYNAVTARRLDPALVTTVGKDRIQLKCFPVPANGDMKVRLGITVPVMVENASTGFLAVPHFQDRNFTITTVHSIWVESKNELAITDPTFRREKGDAFFAVRGRMTDDELNRIRTPIKVSRSPDVLTTWAEDSLNHGTFVKQELKEVPVSPLKKVVLVIDPSADMAAFQSEIGAAVTSLPSSTAVTLVLSGGNGLNADIAAPSSFVGSPTEIADLIKRSSFDGGVDSIPAIETAWEIAQSVPGSGIVWIHGPQLVELDSPEKLAQLWKRRPNEVPVFSVQVGMGRNSVERALDESGAVSTVLRFGDLTEDISRLLDTVTNQHSVFSAVRTVETKGIPATPSSKETSQHLVKLWASEESQRLLAGGDESGAVELAVKNQLVTRVSGAVVLETKAQYDQFGLKPVDPASVPTIPEPHEYLLFAVIASILVYFGWRFRRIRRLSI
ncbi:MAG: VIT domain-containing protein [Pyrinomonadaceae bacterium]